MRKSIAVRTTPACSRAEDVPASSSGFADLPSSTCRLMGISRWSIATVATQSYSTEKSTTSPKFDASYRTWARFLDPRAIPRSCCVPTAVGCVFRRIWALVPASIWALIPEDLGASSERSDGVDPDRSEATS